MKHTVPHELGQERAKKVAVAALDSYKERFAKYEPNARWTNERHADIDFRVKGVSLTGSLDVNPASIELDLEVPFLFKPFKGKAIALIEEEIKKWMAKAKAGEI
ncbi:MAG: polyhydroxyalkanoic acid system family protein [Sorangiineae bacterium]|nr:polyhydroxyalkanoic acid system family protein [Polyangiaceae bacterium]MEB2323542.1 polyhydroxyalkanoic acid system family protein [Sorangiineae bacterium]